LTFSCSTTDITRRGDTPKVEHDGSKFSPGHVLDDDNNKRLLKQDTRWFGDS